MVSLFVVSRHISGSCEPWNAGALKMLIDIDQEKQVLKDRNEVQLEFITKGGTMCRYFTVALAMLEI